MIARVTQGTLTRQLLGHVRQLERRILSAQDALSTGKRLRAPSDDPTGAARANGLRAESRDLSALVKSVNFGTSVLSAQDDLLEQAESLLTRAREIASQQAGGLASTESRQQAAAEVAEIERGLISLANTHVGGRYVFAGLASGAPPFTALDDGGFDPLNPYSGPSDPFLLRTTAEGTTRLTTPGDQVFGDSIAAIDELRLTLAAGNAPTTSLDTVEQAAAGLRAERASVGGRARQLAERSTGITTAIARVTVRLGTVENADYAAVITELTQLQAALEATLASGQTLQTSILDYLNL